MVNLTLLSRLNPFLLRLAVLNLLRSEVLTALSWEPCLENKKGLSRAACSCIALYMACCDPKNILTRVWVLLGERRCKWGLQERADPLQIYYFSFSYELGSEGKWNMLEQEEVSGGGY